MASTAKIAVQVSANSAGLNTGLARAQASIGKFGGSVRGLNLSGVSAGFSRAAMGVSSFATAVTGVGVGLGAAGIGASLKSTLDRLDEISHLATGLKDTTESISQLDYAADRMGGSVEDMNKALEKMSKNIGKAQSEGGTFARVFDGIGVSLDDIATMAPSQAFVVIADAISKLPTVFDQATAASDIFGRGGINIIEVLQAGGDEILRYADKYDQLGGTVDSATAKIAADAKDSLGDVTVAIEGLQNKFFGLVGPSIVNGADDLAASIANIGKASEGLGSSGIIDFFSGVSMIGEVIGDWIKFAGVWDSIAGSVKAFVGFAPALFGVGEKLTQSGTGAVNQAKLDKWMLRGDVGNETGKDISRRVADANKRGTTVAGAFMAEADAQLGTALDKSQSAGYGFAKKVDKEATEAAVAVADASETAGAAIDEGATKSLKEMYEEIENNKDAAKELDDQYKEMQRNAERLTEKVKTPWEKYQEEFDSANKMLEQGMISQETYIRAGTAAWEDYQRAINGGGSASSIGGDMPGMGGGMSPEESAFWDYNTLPGGFIGGRPDNFRFMSTPEQSANQGGRQSWRAGDVYGAQQFQQPAEDKQMAEQTNVLKQIAKNTAAPALVG